MGIGVGVVGVGSGTTPLTDGHCGLRVVRILEAATQSLQRGGVAVNLTHL